MVSKGVYAKNTGKRSFLKWEDLERHVSLILYSIKISSKIIFIWLEPKMGIRKRGSKSYKISKARKMKTSKLINKNLEREILEKAIGAN